MSTGSEKLRKKLKEKSILKIGGAFDAMSAKLVEINKFDAVKLVKIASEVLGGKGGGGRKDFAQAGGLNKEKIEEAFKALSKKIN